MGWTNKEKTRIRIKVGRAVLSAPSTIAKPNISSTPLNHSPVGATDPIGLIAPHPYTPPQSLVPRHDNLNCWNKGETRASGTNPLRSSSGPASDTLASTFKDARNPANIKHFFLKIDSAFLIHSDPRNYKRRFFQGACPSRAQQRPNSQLIQFHHSPQPPKPKPRAAKSGCNRLGPWVQPTRCTQVPRFSTKSPTLGGTACRRPKLNPFSTPPKHCTTTPPARPPSPPPFTPAICRGLPRHPLSGCPIPRSASASGTTRLRSR
jgi:hypothetical protein